PVGPLTRLGASGRADRTGFRRAAEELAAYPLPVFCEDWSLPVGGFAQWSRYLAESRRVAPHMRASTIALGVTASCLAWPGPVNNPQHRLRVRTSTPLLVTNSWYDPATPYQWAQAVADQVGDRGRLLTYQGWGHGVYGRTPCTTGAVDRYLIDRALPRRGATCAPAADPEPQERAGT
ncbi:alpha/beta hydrolase, partial [Micromonospora zhanjiangensis]